MPTNPQERLLGSELDIGWYKLKIYSSAFWKPSYTSLLTETRDCRATYNNDSRQRKQLAETRVAKGDRLRLSSKKCAFCGSDLVAGNLSLKNNAPGINHKGLDLQKLSQKKILINTNWHCLLISESKERK
jgi:hypothetical protein